MSKRTYEEIIDYVEWQSQYKCKVISAKPECTFNDLGIEVNVWNVKTDRMVHGGLLKEMLSQ